MPVVEPHPALLASKTSRKPQAMPEVATAGLASGLDNEHRVQLDANNAAQPLQMLHDYGNL
jgi:hypothetical protein